LRGTVSLRPEGDVDGKALDRFELFVDGIQVARCATGGTLEFDTTEFPDGAAELRIVGIEAAPIESQGRLVLPVRINNRGRKIEFSSTAKGRAAWNEPIKLTANAPEAIKIVFFEGMRELGTVNGNKGDIEVNPETLGTGPVTLRARAQFGDDPKDSVLARPISLFIEPGAKLPSRKLRAGMKLNAGLQFKAEGGPTVLMKGTNEFKWLADTKIKPNESFVLAAIFDVPKDGMYQFEVRHVGPLSIKIDGKIVYDATRKETEWNYVPTPLAAGFHQFELKGTGGQPSGMEIRFGSQGAMNLNENQFRHP